MLADTLLCVEVRVHYAEIGEHNPKAIGMYRLDSLRGECRCFPPGTSSCSQVDLAWHRGDYYDELDCRCLNKGTFKPASSVALGLLNGQSPQLPLLARPTGKKGGPALFYRPGSGQPCRRGLFHPACWLPTKPLHFSVAGHGCTAYRCLL